MLLDIVTISTVVNKFWASSLRGIVNNLKFKVKSPIDFLRLGLPRLKIPLGWDQQVLPKKPKSYLLGNHLLKRIQGLIPVRRAKIQKVSSLLIFLIVYGDHITEKYSRFKRTREK